MPNNMVDASAMMQQQGGPAAMGGTEGQPGVPSNPLVAAAQQQPQAAPSPAAAAQKQVQYDHVKQIVHKQSRIVTDLMDLLEPGGDIKKREVAKMATGLVADRVLSAQEMAGYLIDLPDDPARIRSWVEKHALNAEAQLDQVIAMIGGMGNAQPA